MEKLISLRYRGVLSGPTMTVCLVASFILMVVSFAQAVNPVPFVNQPLVPDAAAPGGPGFTLTVNGAGFIPSSVVLWNGSPRTTHFVSQGQLTATIPATDIAKAGTASITVASPGPGGGSSGVAFFSVATPASGVSFTKTDFASGDGDVQVIAADFNGDGKLDLATAVYYDSTLRIFLGNGDGTFSVAPVYSVCQADALVSGDFNGDGIPDLVVAARGCGQVIIFLGNGDGTFMESGAFPVGPGGPWGAPYSIAVGDFNGDGKLDLVTANESNYVSVLLGNGDGTFQSHVDYDLGQLVLHVVVGDFNGDGDLDVAVASPSQNGVAILLGNGDGTFRTGSVIPLDVTDNRYLTAADLNGDGKLDLAIISGNLNMLSVMFGNGDGQFHSGGQYALGGDGADEVAAADFTGNGILDLAVPSFWSSGVALLMGNGDGTFKAPVSYAAGYGARGIAVGDFNGDGRLDFAVGNQYANSISVFLNTPAAVTLTPASLTFAAQAVGTFSPAQSATLKNTSAGALSIASISPASNDFYQSNNCPATLLPDASCTLSVIFTPTSGGTRLGFVTISDDAAGSPQRLPLKGTASGTGSIKLTLSPPALNFDSVPVGTTSLSQTVTVSNVGSVAASFSPPFGFVKETPGCIFHHSPQCGTSLAPNASCDVTLTFTPRAVGTRTGQFVVLQGARTVSIPLSGTGTP